MQTRGTQRNALLLPTSIFLQYRAYTFITHTSFWNAGMYLQLLFYFHI